MHKMRTSGAAKVRSTCRITSAEVKRELRARALDESRERERKRAVKEKEMRRQKRKDAETETTRCGDRNDEMRRQKRGGSVSRHIVKPRLHSPRIKSQLTRKR
eukprot:6180263-Pleurochrysis_carterae.AAC.2